MKKYWLLTDDYAAYRNTVPVPIIGKTEGHWSPTDYLAYRSDLSFDSAGVYDKVYDKVYEDPEVVIWKKVSKARLGKTCEAPWTKWGYT